MKPNILKTNTRRVAFLLLISFLFLWGCEECTRRLIGGFAGSYPFAETWHIEAPEDEVIAAILDVKAEDPLLQPPGLEELVSVRDTTSSTDYWRHVRFYYTDTEEIVHTWTRPEDDYSTTFALVSFSKPGTYHYEYINSDYWYVANKLRIRKFEKKIVQRIKDKIAERKTKKQQANAS